MKRINKQILSRNWRDKYLGKFSWHFFIKKLRGHIINFVCPRYLKNFLNFIFIFTEQVLYNGVHPMVTGIWLAFSTVPFIY